MIHRGWPKFPKLVKALRTVWGEEISEEEIYERIDTYRDNRIECTAIRADIAEAVATVRFPEHRDRRNIWEMSGSQLFDHMIDLDEYHRRRMRNLHAIAERVFAEERTERNRQRREAIR